MIKKGIEVLERIFFPNVCPVCEKVIGANEKICKECIQKVKIVKEPKCEKCGKQLDEDEKLFCNDCESGIHVFNKGVCIFEYTEELKKAIYQFKYNNKRCYSDLFGYVGVKRYRKLLKQWSVEKILPVPMYRKKKQKRGYNQAEEFGRALAEYMGIEMDCNCLIRVRDTKPQKGLSKGERYRNLRKAFAVNMERVKGMTSVLLVDDIYTTGSTLDGCAEVLKKAGVKKVYFLCVAGGK